MYSSRKNREIDRQKTVFILSFVLAGLLICFLLFRLSTPSSDMWNTRLILVHVNGTDEVKEITDQAVIHRIVREVLKKEKEGLSAAMLGPYTYALEFFTENEGYGPLLCYRELGICRFEKDMSGRYTEVPDKFFDWIEEGISKEAK